MRYFKVISLFLTITASLFSQEIFVPFVQDINIERKGNLIRISWVDSPDIYGPVYIYRSPKPIDTNYPVLTGIKEIEIPYGTQSYIDEIGSFESIHYFIVASTETGERYPIMLPYRNAIACAAEDESISKVNIFSLEASPKGDSVSISYQSVDSRKPTVLYRSSRPITQRSDLLSARIVDLNIQAPFIDYPVPGLPYYYALIFAEELERGVVEIIPGYNATIEPVILPAKQDSKPRGDVLLPNLIMPSAIFHGMPESIPESYIPLSNEAELAIESLNTFVKTKEEGPHAPYILEVDFNTPSNSEEYIFYSIVHGAFAGKDWQKAQREFSAFIKLPQNRDLETRAHFYLGQIYFFSGFLQEALLELLSVRKAFPDESYKWIARILTALAD